MLAPAAAQMLEDHSYVTEDDEGWRKDWAFVKGHYELITLKLPHLVRNGLHLKECVTKTNQTEIPDQIKVDDIIALHIKLYGLSTIYDTPPCCMYTDIQGSLRFFSKTLLKIYLSFRAGRLSSCFSFAADAVNCNPEVIKGQPMVSKTNDLSKLQLISSKMITAPTKILLHKSAQMFRF